ncbi:hypothetical protein SRHO_G00302160 [Serrasalmus rhombeus]
MREKSISVIRALSAADDWQGLTASAEEAGERGGGVRPSLSVLLKFSSESSQTSGRRGLGPSTYSHVHPLVRTERSVQLLLFFHSQLNSDSAWQQKIRVREERSVMRGSNEAGLILNHLQLELRLHVGSRSLRSEQNAVRTDRAVTEPQQRQQSSVCGE